MPQKAGTPPLAHLADINGDSVDLTLVGVSSGALTDRSGVITAGGTAQNAMAANASRKYLFLRNPPMATEPLFFNFTTTAVTTGSPSIQLDPGEFFIMESGFISTEAISVIAATTGHKWTAKEG